MPRYRVVLTREQWAEVEIKAENDDDAMDLAEEIAEQRDVFDADPFIAVGVEEVK